jgi:dihydroflavonol-4-reductase
MAKTLVTGAAGFIGSHVVLELLKQNREVRALVLRGENTKNLDGLDIETFEGDVCDPDSMRRAMEGCNRLFHLAAIYALWLPNRRKMYDVNVTGSQNVLWAAYKASVERVVYTSSVAALGVEPGEQLANENTEFNQITKANDYIFSKYLSDRDAKVFAREGLPLTIVNPAFPFGARDIVPTPTGQILLDLVNGKTPGYFDAGFSIVDVEDVARGHILAEEKGKVGESYLMANKNLTFKEFFELVMRVTGVQVKLRKIPVSVAIGLGYLLEYWSNRWSHRPPLLSAKALRYARQYLYFDNGKARNELGLEFTPVESSIRRAVEWFRENGYITKAAYLQGSS